MNRGKKVVSKKLGEVLISRGLISEEQLNEALAIQKKDGGKIGEILVRLKYITEEAIAWALTVMYGFPYLPLENYTIDREIVQLVPEDMARKLQVLAVDRIGAVLTLAVVNPLSEDEVRALEEKTQCKVEIFISTMTEVGKMLDKHYGAASNDSSEQKA